MAVIGTKYNQDPADGHRMSQVALTAEVCGAPRNATQ